MSRGRLVFFSNDDSNHAAAANSMMNRSLIVTYLSSFAEALRAGAIIQSFDP